jgi:hypothetical protein
LHHYLAFTAGGTTVACLFIPPWPVVRRELDPIPMHGDCVSRVKTSAKLRVIGFAKVRRGSTIETHYKVHAVSGWIEGAKEGWLPPWHVTIWS